MLPETGAQVLAKQVVNFVQDEERKDQSILVHGFSGGAYVYTEILQEMLARQKDDQITGRIIGQIYDSGIDVKDISSGLVKALVQNNLLQLGLKKTLEIYMRMTYSFAGQHHERGSRLLWNNPVKAPTLLLYSDTDPLSPSDDNQRLMAHLRANGNVMVYAKMFKGSPHVGHMFKYRDEYVDTLQSFLNQIDH